MLNRLNRPTKPAAAMGVITSLNISWLRTDAWPSTPIPAVTLRQSTSHRSQNWGVLSAWSMWTWLWVIILFCVVGGVQPAGLQSAAGMRMARAPMVMDMK
ncbi:hypothetical protein D9M69_556710 [compost metagenome]